MATRKPILSPDAAAFVRGDAPESPSPQPPPAPAPAAGVQVAVIKKAPAPAAEVQVAVIKKAPAPAPADGEARVRFTVDLPRSLHKRLKLAAMDQELPMTDLARQALGEWLDSRG